MSGLSLVNSRQVTGKLPFDCIIHGDPPSPSFSDILLRKLSEALYPGNAGLEWKIVLQPWAVYTMLHRPLASIIVPLTYTRSAGVVNLVFPSMMIPTRASLLLDLLSIEHGQVWTLMS